MSVSKPQWLQWRFDIRLTKHGSAPSHCATMGRQIDVSWWNHRAIYRSSQCSTTGVKKGPGMCYPVCGMVHM